MLQTVKAELGNQRTKPLCSKGDNTACFKSVNRVRAVMKREFLEEKAARGGLSSAGLNFSGRNPNSNDLRSDGVIMGEANSNHSISDALSSRRHSKQPDRSRDLRDVLTSRAGSSTATPSQTYRAENDPELKARLAQVV